MSNRIKGLLWSFGPQWKASGFEFGNASWEKMTLSTEPLEPDPHPPQISVGIEVKPSPFNGLELLLAPQIYRPSYGPERRTTQHTKIG